MIADWDPSGPMPEPGPSDPSHWYMVYGGQRYTCTEAQTDGSPGDGYHSTEIHCEPPLVADSGEDRIVYDGMDPTWRDTNGNVMPKYEWPMPTHD